MNNNASSWLLIITLFLTCVCERVAAVPADTQGTNSQAIQYPPIATVTTHMAKSSTQGENPNKTMVGESLAFVVEDSGMLLTSYRTLLAPGDKESLLHWIEVELPGERPRHYSASIVAVEPTINIAILRINPDEALPSAKIIDRERIVPGISICAFTGYEQGQPSFVLGTVTGLNRKECYQESMTATMLRAQIDIPDNRSLLGGPVFNSEGEVVALHTGYMSKPGETHGHEIENERHLLPIFLAFNIYRSLKYRKSLKSPWTGFSVRPLTQEEMTIFPYQRFLGGIGIEHVWENSPAEKLGVRQGDIWVRFGYYPIHSPADFQKWLYMYGVEQKVELHFLRNRNEHLTYEYTIEERPAWAKPL